MSFARVPQTAIALWRRERRWRFTVIAAGVATLGAVFAHLGAGGGATATQTTVSNTPPPPNVMQVTKPRIPEIDDRLRRFYQAYVNAGNQDRPGLRCEKLTTAYLNLLPGDEAEAATAQLDAIVAAKACVPLLTASNERLEPLAAAYKRFAQARTLESAEASLAAAQGLNDFDRSRDLAAAGVDAAELGALAGGLQSYRQILAKASTLAPLYRAQDPATLAAANELAELSRALAKLPFAADDAGLGAAERQALAAATTAVQALEESDRRVAVLAAAYTGRAQDPVGLALALGSLTPFDRARVSGAGSAVDLGAAESAARDSVGSAILRSAQAYAKAATFAGAQQLRQLEALATDLGASVPGDARALVAQARADLEGSRVRLAALEETAASWLQVKSRGTRDPAVEARIAQVLAAIVPAGAAEANSFDAGAMDARTRARLDTLLGAWVEVQGRVAPSQRRSLSVAIEGPANADATAQSFLANVASELERLGFTLVKASPGAALVVKLSAPGVQEGGVSAQGLPQRKGSVSGSIVWPYSGRTLDLGTLSALGADRDRSAITRAALRAVAEQVARTVLAKVEGT